MSTLASPRNPRSTTSALRFTPQRCGGFPWLAPGGLGVTILFNFGGHWLTDWPLPRVQENRWRDSPSSHPPRFCFFAKTTSLFRSPWLGAEHPILRPPGIIASTSARTRCYPRSTSSSMKAPPDAAPPSRRARPWHRGMRKDRRNRPGNPRQKTGDRRPAHPGHRAHGDRPRGGRRHQAGTEGVVLGHPRQRLQAPKTCETNSAQYKGGSTCNAVDVPSRPSNSCAFSPSTPAASSRRGSSARESARRVAIRPAQHLNRAQGDDLTT